MMELDLGQTIRILANIGEMAGAVFLAVEINQNSVIIEAAIWQSQAERRETKTG